MMSKLTVVATMKAKSGKEEELKEEVLKLLTPTRAEEGCLNYDLHFSDENPGEVMFYENWTSREALDAHLNTPHLIAFAAKHEELLASPVALKFYRMVGA